MRRPASEEISEQIYRIRLRDGDYFRKWESTGWETVKRFARWTKNEADAAKFTLADLNKSGFMDIVCGFCGVKLERVK